MQGTAMSRRLGMYSQRAPFSRLSACLSVCLSTPCLSCLLSDFLRQAFQAQRRWLYSALPPPATRQASINFLMSSEPTLASNCARQTQIAVPPSPLLGSTAIHLRRAVFVLFSPFTSLLPLAPKAGLWWRRRARENSARSRSFKILPSTSSSQIPTGERCNKLERRRYRTRTTHYVGCTATSSAPISAATLRACGAKF